jgi:hypothetical protein
VAQQNDAKEKKEAKLKDRKATIIQAPAVLPRKIDGLLVSQKDIDNYPIAIMVENAAFDGVRPQFGLSKAQIVYEIVVEGGITRLMAVYAGDMPDKIGPVRSARPTYLEFASEYDALYAHAGGSPDALQAISGLGIKDLSALGTDARFFYRDNTRYAPHNLFTSKELLLLTKRDKQLAAATTSFNSWDFKDEAKPQVEPTAEKSMNISFGSSPLYDVRYVYNYVDNNYERWNGGELQRDANDNSILTTKNIVVQIVPPASSAGDKGRINFDVNGEGKVFIARDGEVIEGIWKKPNRKSRTEFFTTDGKTIQLDRGTTWVEIVPTIGSVTYN